MPNCVCCEQNYKTAANKTWQNNYFYCCKCQRPLNNKFAKIFNNNEILCENCWSLPFYKKNNQEKIKCIISTPSFHNYRPEFCMKLYKNLSNAQNCPKILTKSVHSCSCIPVCCNSCDNNPLIENCYQSPSPPSPKTRHKSRRQKYYSKKSPLRNCSICTPRCSKKKYSPIHHHGGDCSISRSCSPTKSRKCSPTIIRNRSPSQQRQQQNCYQSPHYQQRDSYLSPQCKNCYYFGIKQHSPYEKNSHIKSLSKNCCKSPSPIRKTKKNCPCCHPFRKYRSPKQQSSQSPPQSPIIFCKSCGKRKKFCYILNKNNNNTSAKMTTPYCRRCGDKVFAAEKFLTSYGAYHNLCFSCYCCGKSLHINNMYEARGEIYCKQCYNYYFGINVYRC